MGYEFEDVDGFMNVFMEDKKHVSHMMEFVSVFQAQLSFFRPDDSVPGLFLVRRRGRVCTSRRVPLVIDGLKSHARELWRNYFAVQSLVSFIIFSTPLLKVNPRLLLAQIMSIAFHSNPSHP